MKRFTIFLTALMFCFKAYAYTVAGPVAKSVAGSVVPSAVVGVESGLTEQIVTNENTSLTFTITDGETAYSTYHDGPLTDPDTLGNGSYTGEDNSLATSSCSGNACSIQADFGEVINVTEINYACIPATEPGGFGIIYARDHDLEYSVNGTDWTEIDAEPLSGAWADCTTTYGQDVDIEAQYVRINKGAADIPNWIGVSEFWFRAML